MRSKNKQNPEEQLESLFQTIILNNLYPSFVPHYTGELTFIIKDKEQNENAITLKFDNDEDNFFVTMICNNKLHFVKMLRKDEFEARIAATVQQQEQQSVKQTLNIFN